MHEAPPSRSTVLALALVLLAGSLAGCAQSPPPDDPSQKSYILRADQAQKAPHPASYEGDYGSLTIEGPHLRAGVDGPVHVLEEDDGAVTFPAQVAILQAEGTFDPDGGDPVTLDGETVHVTAEESFDVTGLRSVDTRDATFQGGTVVARTTVAGDAGFNASRRVTAGGDGATAADVRVAVGDDARAQNGRNGTLTLETGAYEITGSPLEFTPTATVQVPEASAEVTLDDPDANVTLRGQARSASHLRLEATRLSGSVDVAASQATLDMGLHQWWEDERPRFEARLDAAFEGGGRTVDVTVEQGGNATFWTRATETSNVGSAEAVRPRVDAPPGADDDPLVDAGFGVYWYGNPNPSAMEQFMRAVIFPAKAFQALFEDPATREFAPGQEAYIPFGIEVADDTPPGSYTVDGWFHGENAKSPHLEVQVTVEQG